MRRNRIHTRRENNKTLLILLLTFFIFDNIFLSFSTYISDRMEECLLERSLHVYSTVDYGDAVFLSDGYLGDYDEEKLEEYIASGKRIVERQFQLLDAYLRSTDGILSWMERREDVTSNFISYKNGEKVCFYTNDCDYESIKDYILTEGCGEPGEYEVILPKYYGLGSGRDMGTWLLGVTELGYEEYDAEELVGKTITGTSYGQEIALKVIGVYDNRALGLTNALCYGAETVETLENGFDELNLQDEDRVEYWEERSNVGYYVVCETREDMQALMDYIDENLSCLKGSMMGSLQQGQITVVTAFTAVGNIILLFLLANLIVNIVYTEEQVVHLRRREYGLMKAAGYRTLDVGLVHIWEAAKSTLIGLALTFAGGAMLFFLLNCLMAPFLNYTFSTFRIRVLPGVAAATVLVGIAASVVGNGIGLQRIAQMRVAEAVKAEE